MRNNTRGRQTLYLEYEAYEEMALKQMEGLANEETALRLSVSVPTVERKLQGIRGIWENRAAR